MGLSKEYIENHIATWEQNLSNSRYPWTSHWPSRIFRHDPLENIAQIIESGNLLSRNDSVGVRSTDIAAREAVNSTTQPHQYVRLYFRPRTPTQYHVEGIRKPGERYQTDKSCLIGLMIFESRNLLNRNDVMFSNMNMQSSLVLTGNTENFFAENINFANVYHHGWQGSDSDIRRQRCAEVLLNSPLQITECLQYIYCRTNAERETLISMLSNGARQKWKDKILVSRDMKLFERKYCFVEDVYITATGVIINLSPREDNANINLEVTITDTNTGMIPIQFQNADFRPLPSSGKKGWIFEFEVQDSVYDVQIKIEGSIGYRSKLRFTALPF